MSVRYLQTLQRLPRLTALWKRMLNLSNDYRDLTLIQDCPFMIIDNSLDWEVVNYSFSNVRFAPYGRLGDAYSLWPELFLIERLVHEGDIPAEKLEILELRSKELLEVLEKRTGILDEAYARYLDTNARIN